MATLFYLPADTTADVSPTPDGTDWAHVNNVSRKLQAAQSATASASVSYSPDAGDHLTDVNAMSAQFVSDVLPPQTIPAGSVVCSARCSEPVATSNLSLAWKLYAVNAAGTVVLGTLVAVRRDDTEFATSLTGRRGAATSTAFTSLVPFRLVLEIGAGGLPTASGSVDGHNSAIEFGSAFTQISLSGSTTQASSALIFREADLKLAVQPHAGLQPLEAGITG